jgi:hypothetical protein
MFIFITNNNNQKIEKFDDSVLKPANNYPALSNTAVITLINYNMDKTTDKKLNIQEKYDVVAASSLDNLGTNGYGTTYINSSFMFNVEPNANSSISSLFNNTISLKLNSFNSSTNNYISIIFPEKFQFKRIEMQLDSNLIENYITNKKIYLYAFNNANNNYYQIKTTPTLNDNILILSLNGVITFNNLIIFFDKSITTITLKNIKVFGYPINTDIIMNIDDNSVLQQEDTINIFTENINSQFAAVDTTSYGQQQQENVYDSTTPISEQFNSLLNKNNPPWAMYSGKNITSDKLFLTDLFGRDCKKASITGGDVTIVTNEGQAKLNYIKGKKNTSIIFPVGSLPSEYTICVLTKYTSTDRNARGRILTTNSTYNPNWLLGHWANQAGGVTYNNGWIYYSWRDDGENINWRVSCMKSSANNQSYSLIIDDINKAWGNARGNSNPNACLTINGIGGYTGETSEFGFAYLIIWDFVLSDGELLIVSKALTNYVNTGEELKTDGIIISLKDGKSQSTAGRSAYHIKLATCTNDNGVYWILKDNGDAIQIYCIMDSACFGGGWMLAMKGSKTTVLFGFESVHWKTDTVVNNNDFNIVNDASNNLIDSKYEIFNYFKVSQCLAIFDSNDTNGAINLPNYGWAWLESSFYDGQRKLSLKEFYANDYAKFVYYSSGGHDFVASFNSRNAPQKYDYNFVRQLDINRYNQTVENTIYPGNVWARQDQFKAYGFNIKPLNPYGWRGTAVRWGGTFNENPGGVPDTNDVGGGIGLGVGWNAGNYIGCCQSEKGVGSKQMCFRWYIK